jgi:hypothetical protein
LFALGLGGAGVVLGVVLAVGLGRLLVGLAILLLGVVLVGLAVDAARRWPTSAVAQLFVRFVDIVGSRVGLARVSAGAWAQAAREVIRLRQELRGLREQRDQEQFALGAAAYQQDDEQVTSLRERLKGLEQQIERRQQTIGEVTDRARDQVDRKRAAIQPTQPFAVEESRPPGDSGPEEQGTATAEHITEPRPPRDGQG